MANLYFDIPEPIRIKAIEAGAPKPQLSITLQAAPEKAALGYPGKNAGDVLFNGAAGTLLVSLGEAPKMITDTFRVAGGSVGRWLVQNAAPSAEISVNNVNGFGIPNALAAFCEGLLLGVFKFDRHKKASNSIEPITVSVRAQ
ncbi:MAG TPA: M17 family peptidase N-terminal domain-containing protein, partial [Anaerolineaceae bacterium]|nr:M17 family peptidase N-terminal domain-containing protein [Anaerolineaceae bacterium]